MGVIVNIDFEQQSPEIKDCVKSYWTKRADSFFDIRREELESKKAEQWLEEINVLLKEKKDLKILDVGCGAGFFEVLMGKEGHSVTGIDLTEDMIGKANEMIRIYELDPERVRAMQMDAEKLDFEDETFDVVISRNLTWTLPHPIAAYREWFRVLKKGGVLLNFDAEYAKHAHENLYSPENIAHTGISDDMKDECHEIYHMLTVSALERPFWDEAILKVIGFEEIASDKGFADRVYVEKDRFYTPDRMFSIRAVKADA
ncbi:MAG: class I SAM-dependent methyltransferase [Eubacteriales bacterium]|nr:class I SAM-dependent methyltransferase [Eubacteriales bacterium]